MGATFNKDEFSEARMKQIVSQTAEETFNEGSKNLDDTKMLKFMMAYHITQFDSFEQLIEQYRDLISTMARQYELGQQLLGQSFGSLRDDYKKQTDRVIEAISLATKKPNMKFIIPSVGTVGAVVGATITEWGWKVIRFLIIPN